jgi:hypothetical protein
MLGRSILSLAILASLGAAEKPVVADGFAGWQDLRVIRLEDQPQTLSLGDVDGDGRDDLVVPDERNARLVLISWVPLAQRSSVTAPSGNVNEIPMAKEFSRTEIPLESLPVSAAIAPTPHGTRIIVVTRRGELITYARSEKKTWEKERTLQLLQADYSSRVEPLVWDASKILIACVEGIQVASLQGSDRPVWLRPQEGGNIVAWNKADLDGDGVQDLLTQVTNPQLCLRWYRGFQGTLLPAQIVGEKNVRQVACLRSVSGPALLASLSDHNRTTVRLGQMKDGAIEPFGRRIALPMSKGTPLTGLNLAGKPVLLMADRKNPQLQLFLAGNESWTAAETFPCPAKIQGLVAVAAVPGLVLVWSEDDGDLMTSSWKDNRFTFPRSWVQQSAAKERKVLGLGRHGATTWWVQKQDEDLTLYRWGPESATPAAMVFAKAGAKAAKALWIGGDRLLVEDSYARCPSLITPSGRSEQSHLGRLNAEEWCITAEGSQFRLGKKSDGVVQWLGEDLKPSDQVMLDPGRKLADLVQLPDGSWWALESEGFLHRMQADSAGILRIAKTISVPPAQRLTLDPVLGPLLISEREVIRLLDGPVRNLHTLASMDARLDGLLGQSSDSEFDRVLSLSGGGTGDLLLVTDDAKHQVTLLRPKGETLQPLASWPVFESRSMPYGRSRTKDGEDQPEPRIVATANLDGDAYQDLVLLCQDRLLIYLGRKESKTAQGGKP